MALAETIVVCVGLLLLAACLAGLTVRGRHRLCVSFTLYLAAVHLEVPKPEAQSQAQDHDQARHIVLLS